MIKLGRNSISFWIGLGYIIIVSISIISTIISTVIVLRTKSSDKEIVEVTLPLYYSIKDFSYFISETGSLTSKWVSQSNTGNERADLTKMLNEKYNELNQNIRILIEKQSDQKINTELVNLLKVSEKLIEDEKYVTNALKLPEDYENFEKLDEILTYHKANIEDILPGILTKYNKWLEKQKVDEVLNNAQQSKDAYFNFILSILISSTLLFIGIALYVYNKTKKEVVLPIIKLKDSIEEISNGKLEKLKLKNSEDEIGKISISINHLIGLIQRNTEFAQEIGKGNYEYNYDTEIKDVMGLELIDMRKNLMYQSEKERKISWIATGLAQFSELLRKEYNDEFYDNIMYSIINYTHSNQGGIFILEEIDKKKALVMKSCYAYERKKFIDSTLDLGEGITGQCFLEKRTLLITEIPQNYVHITSGLGHATPTCLIAVPLKLNDVVVGVLEMASFKIFEAHEIEFIEKTCESIASTVISLKVSQQTKILLEESQIQSHALKQQEEEMRQNMEEMLATQEEMARKEIENQSLMDEMKEKEELLRENLAKMAVQEEEMKQNLEEMLATQEEMATKEKKLEDVVQEMSQKEILLKQKLDELNDIQEEMAEKEKRLQEIVHEMQNNEEQLKQSFDMISKMKEDQANQHKKQMAEEKEVRLKYEKELSTMMDLWNLHLDNIEKIIRKK